jgi:hypothetical protein
MTTVLNLVTLAVAVLAFAVAYSTWRDQYRDWRSWRKWAWWRYTLRFGERGIPGWLLAQWYRLRPPKIDYQMVPPETPAEPGRFYPALAKEGEHPWAQWGPPACQCGDENPGELQRRLSDPEAVKKMLAEMPDWSGLTDAELDEKVKTAMIGSGLLAEKGYRDFRKGQTGASE